MNELEKKYMQKKNLLKHTKELFYEDKEKYKKFFHRQSINVQARLLAFLQVNDSKFYKEFNDYIGGCKF